MSYEEAIEWLEEHRAEVQFIRGRIDIRIYSLKRGKALGSVGENFMQAVRRAMEQDQGVTR